jgi:hypothetical protein
MHGEIPSWQGWGSHWRGRQGSCRAVVEYRQQLGEEWRGGERTLKMYIEIPEVVHSMAYTPPPTAFHPAP